PWLSSSVMLECWKISNWLLQSWFGAATFDIPGETTRGGAVTCTQIVDYWSTRLFDSALDQTTRSALIAFLAQTGDPNAAPKPRRDSPDWNDPAAVADRIVATVMLM